MQHSTYGNIDDLHNALSSIYVFEITIFDALNAAASAGDTHAVDVFNTDLKRIRNAHNLLERIVKAGE